VLNFAPVSISKHYAVCVLICKQHTIEFGDGNHRNELSNVADFYL